MKKILLVAFIAQACGLIRWIYTIYQKIISMLVKKSLIYFSVFFTLFIQTIVWLLKEKNELF